MKLTFIFLLIDGIVNILFAIDILFTFNTAIEDKDGDLIADRSIVNSRYLKGWFTIDLVSTVPFVEMFQLMNLGTHLLVVGGVFDRHTF